MSQGYRSPVLRDALAFAKKCDVSKLHRLAERVLRPERGSTYAILSNVEYAVFCASVDKLRKQSLQ